MRKLIFTAAVLAMLAACGDGDKGKENNEATSADPAENTSAPAAAETADISSSPDYQKGLELIGQNDCLTCHKVDEAFIGPTYRDVANKYASQAPGIIPELAKKIIEGGSGVWGQVPMIPHASLSQADAETMVKYILLLKK